MSPFQGFVSYDALPGALRRAIEVRLFEAFRIANKFFHESTRKASDAFSTRGGGA